ncbi:MAG: hypothetical protein Q7S89_00730 [bacterium]|nr:hypothetical protein [bacterium]
MFAFLNRHIACMFIAWLLITVPYWALVRFGGSEITALGTAGGMCVAFALIGLALPWRHSIITGCAILATALMQLAFVLDRVVNTASETSPTLGAIGTCVTLFASASASIAIMWLGLRAPMITGSKPESSELIQFRDTREIASLMSWWYILLMFSVLTFTMQSAPEPASAELPYMVILALAPVFAGLVYLVPKPVPNEPTSENAEPAPSIGDSSPAPAV